MKKENSAYPKKAVSDKAAEPAISYDQAPGMTMLSQLSPHQIFLQQLEGNLLVKVQEETSLSAQELAAVMGISKTKYYDMQKETLDPRSIDTLADFAQLWKLGMEAFDGQLAQLQEWFHTRNKNLGNVKPITLLATRLGRRALEKAFQRIEYGLYG
jgi:putative toxin-antitoxin system antitoxin component (TIGR02293 family)